MIEAQENGVRYKSSAKDDTKKEGGQALHLPLRVRLPHATLLRPLGRLYFSVHQFIIIDLCFYYMPVVQRQLRGAGAFTETATF